ncbi:thiopurine S-methyltransferase-like [Lytechinus pictus]|uniref:thiopurine S-methyltransferase-like n=1 Tax=Lytechinus pictus TaxID=7653 RepID=UPI0030B9CF66
MSAQSESEKAPTGPVPSEEEWEKTWLGTDDKPLDHADRPVTQNLIKFVDRLTNGKTGSTIFLPLCGMSNDIKWLVDQGHRVIGLDIVEKSFRLFFEKYQMSFTVNDLPNIPNGKVFENKEKTIKLFKCNMFDFDVSLMEKVDGIWDCGALIVISTPDRPKYGQMLLSVLKPGGRILNQSYQFIWDDESKAAEMEAGSVYEDYPCPDVEEKDYHLLYGARCNIEYVGEKDVTNEPDWAGMGVVSAKENIHLMTLK